MIKAMLYRRKCRGKWVERLCIDLDHIGCRHEALNACIKGLADPIVEVSCLCNKHK